MIQKIQPNAIYERLAQKIMANDSNYTPKQTATVKPNVQSSVDGDTYEPTNPSTKTDKIKEQIDNKTYLSDVIIDDVAGKLAHMLIG